MTLTPRGSIGNINLGLNDDDDEDVDDDDDDDDDDDGDDDVPLLAVIGGMMVHSVLKSQQIGQHITTDGKPIPANGGAFPLNTRKHCTTMYSRAK